VLIVESHQVPATVVTKHQEYHHPPPVLVAVWAARLPASAGVLVGYAGCGYSSSLASITLQDKVALDFRLKALRTVFKLTPNAVAVSSVDFSSASANVRISKSL
jgi:hypothetical protein